MYIDWHSNKVKRIYTGIVIVAGIVAAFSLRLFTVWIFDVFVLALAGIAVWEVSKAKKLDSKGVSIFYLLAYIAVAYSMFALGINTGFEFWLHAVMQIVVLFIFFLYTMLMNYIDKDFIKEATLKKINLSKASFKTSIEFLKVVIYPFLLLATLIPLNHMGSFAPVTMAEGEAPINAYHIATLGLMMVFMISCFSDTFAYMTGFALRGPKLCPKISPNKTISGAIGGLFGGVTGALLALIIMAQSGSPVQALLTDKIGDTVAVQLVFVALGFFGSVVTQVGDIYASWIKRRTGIKDYGSFLPGHGGAMDRLDGICFNALFIYLSFAIMVFA